MSGAYVARHYWPAGRVSAAAAIRPCIACTQRGDSHTPRCWNAGLETRKCYAKRCDSERSSVEQHVDLGQAFTNHQLLHDATALYCCPRNRDPSSTQISTSSRRRSVLIAVQKLPTVRRPLSGLSGLHSVLQACSCTTVYSTSKGGEGVLQLTWPANTTTFNPLRVLCGYCELARLHSSCVERISPHLLARLSLPCGSSAVFVFLHPCQEARRDNVSPN